MSEFRRCLFGLLTRSLPVVFMILIANISGAQGIPAGGGLDLAPSNPFGMPGTTAGLPQGSNALYLNSGMLRDILGPIPNLEIGYMYHFGKSVRTSRLTFDYFLPVSFGSNSAAFGETHGEFINFWNTVQSLLRAGNTITSDSGFNGRIDLSFGGGYRRIIAGNTLLGLNGFYDSARLGGTWYSSGSLGLEAAALLPGDDAIDLSFNWYGKLFSGAVISNAFRNGPSNFDIQAGYSHELYNEGPDLRMHASAYRFSAGNGVYGWRAGAELKTRDGMFSVKYEIAEDPINSTYHTVGGFINVGLQLERLFGGESPFVMPEPIFGSPRNLRKWLSQPARRSWAPPISVVLTRRSEMPAGGCGCGGSCHGLAYGATVAQHAAEVDTGKAYFIPFHTSPIRVCDLNTNVAGNRRKMSIWFRGRVTGGSIEVQVNVMHAVPLGGGGYSVTWSPVYGFWFRTIPEGYHDFLRIVDQVVLPEAPGVRGIEVMRQAGLDAIGVFVRKNSGTGKIQGSSGEPWHFHVEFNEP